MRWLLCLSALSLTGCSALMVGFLLTPGAGRVAQPTATPTPSAAPSSLKSLRL
jgi:hypothetical protein